MSTIRINEGTSVKQVIDWNSDKDDLITFEILHKSSFQVFAEGIALGVLRTLVHRGKRIKIELYKSLNIDKGVKIEDIHPIFTSIFGLELLRVSSQTVFQATEVENFRSVIGELVWGRIIEQGGIIGDGKTTYLFSRHDYEIPKCLRHGERSDLFPRFDYFHSKFSSFLSKMHGQKKGNSPEERDLIEWLHHIAENAFEHGRYSAIRREFTEGFRGILLGKSHFSRRNEVYVRKDYPAFVRNYMKSLVKNGRCPPSNFAINYATVMDLGDGIQHTLRSDSEKTDFELLQYAFVDGVTRKQNFSKEKAGFGLGQAMNSAVSLGAILHIASAEVETYIDFSTENFEEPQKGALPFSSERKLGKSIGTSVSILWISASKASKEGF